MTLFSWSNLLICLSNVPSPGRDINALVQLRCPQPGVVLGVGREGARSGNNRLAV